MSDLPFRTRRSNSPRRALAACGAALVLGLMGLLNSPAMAQDAAPAEQAAGSEGDERQISYPAITVSTVTEQTLRDRVIASGLVRAVEEVQVQPLVDGQAVEELLADLGDRVEAGQVLALLSGSTFDLRMSELRAQGASVEAAIAQAQAQLIEAQTSAEEAERVATRNIALREQGTISQAQADQAEAAAAAARARVRVAEQGIAAAEAQRELVAAQMATLELQQDRTEVRAPVAGLVVERNAQVGAIATGMGAPMFTLIRDGALELHAEIAEADIGRLQVGQTALMTPVGGGAPIPGTIRMIAPAIDTATRLGEARVTIDTPEAVRPGMFMTAEILVEEAVRLAVPVTAIGAAAEGATVMRVEDGLVTRVPVVTGARDGAMMAILEGLEPGDQVVTRAAAFVRDGDRITPIMAEVTASATEGAAP